ncbi:TlpA family protein disulfide reductase [Nannocystis radixulma]|uniref:TlpA family protein disulfide reductase n=1 Tax=Nannocystis radixulma TaxID=2995305 RepID=A0ABT5BH22_9BACT|nr:TlpA family protein disulfide reductase [Nannocystis radixulma]MDC0673445.1 TlpA family protein disulfide reductase [Nannocystis radixulma]
MRTQDPPVDAREVDLEDAAVPELADDDSAASPEVGDARVRHGRLASLRRLLLALALVGVIVWSWQALQQFEARSAHPSPARREAGPRVIASTPVAELESEPHRPEEAERVLEALLKGVPVRAFLDAEVERFEQGQTSRERLKASAILARQVTLVNLWATWCEPCNRELPGLRDMFERGRREQGWGAETRFVALMVDDASTAETAHRTVRASLPADTVFMVDYGLNGGVRPTLERSRLLVKDASLPISLLFDCQRRVRWHHVGELKADDFAVLSGQIDLLRAERGTAACAEPRSRAAEEETQAGASKDPSSLRAEAEGTQAGASKDPPFLRDVDDIDASVDEPAPIRARVRDCDETHLLRCGDGCCDRGENCRDCARDCGCERGEICVHVQEQAPRCSMAEARLGP